MVDYAARIEETADGLYGVSEKARDLVDESVDRDADREPVELVAQTERVVSTMADNHLAIE